MDREPAMDVLCAASPAVVAPRRGFARPLALALLAIFAVAGAQAQTQTVNTLAGGGIADNNPATVANTTPNPQAPALTGTR